MKKSKLEIFPLPIIALILEILPYGAVLNFANPEGKPWRRTFSYFSLTPFGYANFAPFITALLTCLILLLAFIYCFTEKNKLLNTIKILSCISAITSVMPILYGLNYFSVVGVAITISLFCECAYLFIKMK